MLLNAETDYAIRIVAFLADTAELCDARRVAEGTAVPLRFCIKILNKLKTGRIVASSRGAQGGYRLARPACEITLFEVIEKISGGCEFIHCQCGEAGCTNPGGLCRFMPAFDRASADVKRDLSSVTFANKEK